MSMSNSFETELLEHIFQNADIADVGDATGLRGSSAAGNLYIALHTGDPGEAGDQSTNEADYTSYARVAVARSAGGWTVAGNNVSNAAEIAFPEKTGGDDDIVTHFSIGKESSGATDIIGSGALDASRTIRDGDTPTFAIGELDVDAD